MAPTRSPIARDIARQLMALESAGAADPAALQRLCTRVAENLRHSVGDDGYNALLSRVQARTNGEHPALASILLVDRGAARLGDVTAAVTAHGVDAVRTALESMFTALAEVLSSLIGADMVLNILDSGGPRPPAASRGNTP
jgi:hypothetical protein